MTADGTTPRPAGDALALALGVSGWTAVEPDGAEEDEVAANCCGDCTARTALYPLVLASPTGKRRVWGACRCGNLVAF